MDDENREGFRMLTFFKTAKGMRTFSIGFNGHFLSHGRGEKRLSKLRLSQLYAVSSGRRCVLGELMSFRFSLCSVSTRRM
jgi:hypothetical protein